MLEKLTGLLKNLVSPAPSTSGKNKFSKEDGLKLLRNGLLLGGVSALGYWGTELAHFDLPGWIALAATGIPLAIQALNALRTDNTENK